MSEPLSEIEKQVLHVAEAQIRVEGLKNRIALLKQANRSATLFEALLETYMSNLELRKARLARLTARSRGLPLLPVRRR